MTCLDPAHLAVGDLSFGEWTVILYPKAAITQTVRWVGGAGNRSLDPANRQPYLSPTKTEASSMIKHFVEPSERDVQAIAGAAASYRLDL